MIPRAIEGGFHLLLLALRPIGASLLKVTQFIVHLSLLLVLAQLAHLPLPRVIAIQEPRPNPFQSKGYLWARAD